MKERMRNVAIQLKAAILLNPAEVVISIIFFILGCINSYYYSFPVEFTVKYFPAFFLSTYTLNYITINKKKRYVYYLSTIFFLPFLVLSRHIAMPIYAITIIVFQLIYLSGKRQRDNKLFIRECLIYLKALFSALLLASVVWLVSISIYYSIRYIFEIWQTGESKIINCISYFSFILILPLLFLMFNERKEQQQTYNKLFDVLLNYVLSPALLIYAIILYLYFIKITVQWSLPKGGIAYIVVSFIVVIFLLKGCQPFLRRRYYDWFYKSANIIVLPTLAMYWVGACYRINQYGFTELRVYLIIVGLILSAMVLLFFSKRWGRYLYIAYISIILLSVVSYIPGITAEDIEIYSQEYREKKGLTDHDKANLNNYSSYQIENNEPIDIQGYKTLSPVSFYEKQGGVWMNYIYNQPDNDSIYFYSANDELIFGDKVQDLFDRQLKKCGIGIGDSIPESVFPQLLQFDMDSAVLVIKSITVYRHLPEQPYKVSYFTPDFYLKK